jgi:hypothetical protein
MINMIKVAYKGNEYVYLISYQNNEGKLATISAAIIEEDDYYIKVQNSRGYQSLINKDLISTVNVLRGV